MNNRKRQVIEASLQLFTEQGFQQTSIQDILDKAKISKGTFYNYFSSKNECLLAILEQRRYEASLRRYELMIGQDKKNIDILVKQITVLLQINQEQNLISMFEGIYHSGDLEQKRLLAHHRLYEIEWLAERFVDIFGEEARPYSYECSVLFFGMMQHLFISWHNAHDTPLDPELVVNSVIRNITVILPKMMETKVVILGEDTIQIIQQKLEKKILTKEIIVEQLTGFQKGLHCMGTDDIGEEFSSYLLQELKQENPRYHVIQALLKPFRETFEKTPHIAEAREISNAIWYFLKSQHH